MARRASARRSRGGLRGGAQQFTGRLEHVPALRRDPALAADHGFRRGARGAPRIGLGPRERHGQAGAPRDRRPVDPGTDDEVVRSGRDRKAVQGRQNGEFDEALQLRRAARRPEGGDDRDALAPGSLLEPVDAGGIGERHGHYRAAVLVDGAPQGQRLRCGLLPLPDRQDPVALLRREAGHPGFREGEADPHEGALAHDVAQGRVALRSGGQRRQVDRLPRVEQDRHDAAALVGCRRHPLGERERDPETVGGQARLRLRWAADHRGRLSGRLRGGRRRRDGAGRRGSGGLRARGRQQNRRRRRHWRGRRRLRLRDVDHEGLVLPETARLEAGCQGQAHLEEVRSLLHRDGLHGRRQLPGDLALVERQLAVEGERRFAPGDREADRRDGGRFEHDPGQVRQGGDPRPHRLRRLALLADRLRPEPGLGLPRPAGELGDDVGRQGGQQSGPVLRDEVDEDLLARLLDVDPIGQRQGDAEARAVRIVPHRRHVGGHVRRQPLRPDRGRLREGDDQDAVGGARADLGRRVEFEHEAAEPVHLGAPDRDLARLRGRERDEAGREHARDEPAPPRPGCPDRAASGFWEGSAPHHDPACAAPGPERRNPTLRRQG